MTTTTRSKKFQQFNIAEFIYLLSGGIQGEQCLGLILSVD